MGDYYGYVILAIFAVIFIGISIFVSKKFPIEGVDDFVAAGRGIPSSLVAASVMVSWVWTTTIMGSAEAGMSFGNIQLQSSNENICIISEILPESKLLIGWE